MTWAKFDDGLPTNRKWRRVVKRSPEAGCLWVASICYSARFLLDGRIPKDELDEVGPFRKPEKLAELLVEERMFEDGGDVWVVHDYLTWNLPAEEVRARQEADRERKAKQRMKGAKSVKNGPGGRFVPAGQDAGHPPEVPADVPQDEPPDGREPSTATRPVPSRPTESQLLAPAKPSRKPDPLWEAVMDACGIQPEDITESSRGAYNRAVSDLRKLGVDPDEVRHRAAAYRMRWSVGLTPTALVRRWAECSDAAALQPKVSNGQSALMRAQARGNG